ncbi:hypothetical protein EGW08_018142 [Elysia chlorotica]|uniref:G-protein coupled receptors family 1 profile domain-containing protein n=1 Tax=Elysia chlorotica TaxID=188477 RepID=A0A433SXP7_ELYCH|nr:hypothetical protein EGW08_018142 [Elysia chlorotica]
MIKCIPHSTPLFWGTHGDPFVYNKSTIVEIIFHSCELLLGTLGTCLNLFLVITILMNEEIKQERSSYLTMSLAVADIFVSGGIIMTESILFLSYTAPVHDGKRPTLLVCQMWAGFATFACSLSSLNLPAIALDRYICISRPLHYEVVMTSNRLASLLGVVWVISLGAGFLPLTWPFSQTCYTDDGSDTFEVPPFSPLNGSFNELVFMLEPGSSCHPLRMCLLSISPLQGIALATVVIIAPSIILVVICILKFRITSAHKNSVNFTLGTVNSLPDTHKKFMFPSSISLGIIKSSFMRRDPGTSDIDNKSVSQVDHANVMISSEESSSVDMDESNESLDQAPPLEHDKTLSFSDKFVALVNVSSINMPKMQSLPKMASKPSVSRTISNFFGSGVDDIKKYKSRSMHARIASTTSVKSLRDKIAGRSDGMSSFLQGASKAFRVLALVVGSYLLSWLPLGFNIIVQSIWPGAISLRSSQAMLKAATFTACVNPIICSLSDKRLLGAMKSTFSKHSSGVGQSAMPDF